MTPRNTLQLVAKRRLWANGFLAVMVWFTTLNAQAQEEANQLEKGESARISTKTTRWMPTEERPQDENQSLLEVKDRGAAWVVDVDNRPTLKDLLTNNTYICYELRDYLRHAPMFHNLLDSIQKVEWYLAARISDEVGQIRVCETKGNLIKLPPNERRGITEYDYQGTPVAIRLDERRVGKVIYLAKTIFDRMEPIMRGLLFIHEIMHSFIPYDVERRDSRLWSMVNIVHENYKAAFERSVFRLQIEINALDIFPALNRVEPYQHLIERFAFLDRATTDADYDEYWRYLKIHPEFLAPAADNVDDPSNTSHRIGATQVLYSLPLYRSKRLIEFHKAAVAYIQKLAVDTFAKSGGRLAAKDFLESYYTGEMGFPTHANLTFYYYRNPFNLSKLLGAALGAYDAPATLYILEHFGFDEKLMDVTYNELVQYAIPEHKVVALAILDRLKTQQNNQMPWQYARRTLMFGFVEGLQKYETLKTCGNCDKYTFTVTRILSIPGTEALKLAIKMGLFKIIDEPKKTTLTLRDIFRDAVDDENVRPENLLVLLENWPTDWPVRGLFNPTLYASRGWMEVARKVIELGPDSINDDIARPVDPRLDHYLRKNEKISIAEIVAQSQDLKFLKYIVFHKHLLVDALKKARPFVKDREILKEIDRRIDTDKHR